MRPLPLAGFALALTLALGAAACSDSGQNVPADEPGQTGSLPADPAAPPADPMAPAAAPEEPLPAEPLPEEPVEQPAR